jgi:hypothetical protein
MPDTAALLHVNADPNTELPSVYVNVASEQIGVAVKPEIRLGNGSTVMFTCTVPLQPSVFGEVYVIVVVPAATPVIFPVDASIVATDGSELVHTPPVVLADNVRVEPLHTEPTFDIIGAGVELTVMFF